MNENVYKVHKKLPHKTLRVHRKEEFGDFKTVCAIEPITVRLEQVFKAIWIPRRRRNQCLMIAYKDEIVFSLSIQSS